MKAICPVVFFLIMCSITHTTNGQKLDIKETGTNVTKEEVTTVEYDRGKNGEESGYSAEEVRDTVDSYDKEYSSPASIQSSAHARSTCSIVNNCYGTCFRWGVRYCRPWSCKGHHCKGCTTGTYCEGRARCRLYCKVYRTIFLPWSFTMCRCANPYPALQCNQKSWLQYY